MKAFASDTRHIFVGVTDPSSHIRQSPEEVRDQILQASKIILAEYLGTTDDCGLLPFCDDVATSRDLAFAKIKSRIEGTRLAEKPL